MDQFTQPKESTMTASTITIPADFVAVSLETLDAEINKIYDEEFRYGATFRTKAQRDRISRRTRPFYGAADAIGAGFTPIAFVGSEYFAQNVRASRAICNECGHNYSIKSRSMMTRHAIKKHGKNFRDIKLGGSLISELRQSQS